MATFKQKLQEYYIPGREYSQSGMQKRIFTGFSLNNTCSLTCAGPFGNCNRTYLNFTNMSNVCPYSGTKLRFIIVHPLEVTNSRW